ncbi:hypothetical protein QBC46DRAFT_420918 [Diplogelasinospora grovesii]|uniref:Suppressor of anucleate metulae protein B n=1 Tax=Diplogelasinospora grovesii TaxID=303347 RepID=A0AAN6NCT3_9PEZI|nr:hypothetical protein QBC46DRAFT_420918 [Diplogelasinospora grovesii]
MSQFPGRPAGMQPSNATGRVKTPSLSRPREAHCVTCRKTSAQAQQQLRICPICRGALYCSDTDTCEKKDEHGHQSLCHTYRITDYPPTSVERYGTPPVRVILFPDQGTKPAIFWVRKTGWEEDAKRIMALRVVCPEAVLSIWSTQFNYIKNARLAGTFKIICCQSGFDRPLNQSLPACYKQSYPAPRFPWKGPILVVRCASNKNIAEDMTMADFSDALDWFAWFAREYVPVPKTVPEQMYPAHITRPVQGIRIRCAAETLRNSSDPFEAVMVDKQHPTRTQYGNAWTQGLRLDIADIHHFFNLGIGNKKYGGVGVHYGQKIGIPLRLSRIVAPPLETERNDWKDVLGDKTNSVASMLAIRVSGTDPKLLGKPSKDWWSANNRDMGDVLVVREDGVDLTIPEITAMCNLLQQWLAMDPKDPRFPDWLSPLNYKSELSKELMKWELDDGKLVKKQRSIELSNDVIKTQVYNTAEAEMNRNRQTNPIGLPQLPFKQIDIERYFIRSANNAPSQRLLAPLREQQPTSLLQHSQALFQEQYKWQTRYRSGLAAIQRGASLDPQVHQWMEKFQHFGSAPGTRVQSIQVPQPNPNFITGRDQQATPRQSQQLSPEQEEHRLYEDLLATVKENKLPSDEQMQFLLDYHETHSEEVDEILEHMLYEQLMGMLPMREKKSLSDLHMQFLVEYQDRHRDEEDIEEQEGRMLYHRLNLMLDDILDEGRPLNEQVPKFIDRYRREHPEEIEERETYHDLMSMLRKKEIPSAEQLHFLAKYQIDHDYEVEAEEEETLYDQIMLVLKQMEQEGLVSEEVRTFITKFRGQQRLQRERPQYPGPIRTQPRPDPFSSGGQTLQPGFQPGVAMPGVMLQHYQHSTQALNVQYGQNNQMLRGMPGSMPQQFRQPTALSYAQPMHPAYGYTPESGVVMPGGPGSMPRYQQPTPLSQPAQPMPPTNSHAHPRRVHFDDGLSVAAPALHNIQQDVWARSQAEVFAAAGLDEHGNPLVNQDGDETEDEDDNATIDENAEDGDDDDGDGDDGDSDGDYEEGDEDDGEGMDDAE